MSEKGIYILPCKEGNSVAYPIKFKVSHFNKFNLVSGNTNENFATCNTVAEL